MQPGRVKRADLIMFLVGLAVVVGAVLWAFL
jgi:predicted nucleic acid-binding Zn ribbon protein